MCAAWLLTTPACTRAACVCARAGLLPCHPLLAPRRLTDGSLANTSNAWGSAAAEAAAPVPPGSAGGGGGGRLSLVPLPGLAVDVSDGGLLTSRSTASGWPSRPTTSKSGAAASLAAGTAAWEHLPRIRTPDSPAGSRGGSMSLGVAGTPTSSRVGWHHQPVG